MMDDKRIILIRPFTKAIKAFKIAAISLVIIVSFIISLIDCLKRDFENQNDKIIWVVVIVFLYAISTLIYFFVVAKNGKYDKKAVAVQKTKAEPEAEVVKGEIVADKDIDTK